MAIAPSKLGQLILREWHSGDDEVLVRRLREAGLVSEHASDDDLRGTFRHAREEHLALRPGEREYNSPHERVRVFLKPLLSSRGQRWAVPLDSLALPDDDPPLRSHWWKFWV